MKLKEQMVAPEGSKADADSFELRRQGARVPDFEAITQEFVLDFLFLGPEEGGKKAAADAAAKDASERAWQEDRWQQERRRQEREREAARAREEAEKEPPKPVMEVEVTVRHAMENMASEVKVKVMTNSTLLDVRHAVMNAIGETKLSEVKLVKRVGGALTTWKNEAEVGDKREFLSMGRKLLPVGGGSEADPGGQQDGQAEQSLPPGDVWLKITSMQDWAHRDVQLAGTRTVRELKAQLCEEAKRSFVGKVKLTIGGTALRDSDKLETIPESEWGNIIADGVELGPPKEVQVKVTHCNSQHFLTVTVLDTITIRQLRMALSDETIGDVAEVKIVRRLMGGSNGGWSAISDSERLNGRTDFFCMGKALEQPPPGQAPPLELTAPVFEDRDISISICLDRDLGITQEVSVKLGSSIRSLKELLAAGDPTHRTQPEDVGLELSSAPGRPLADSMLLTEESMKLDLVQAGQSAEAAAAEDTPTGFMWLEKGVASLDGNTAANLGRPQAGQPFTTKQLDTLRQDPQWSWITPDFLASQGLIQASGDVTLSLTHALDGTSTTVCVPATATILEVRRAVMLAIGQTKLSEVKLLTKGADGDFEALEDGDTISGRTQLYTVGCPLA